MATPSEGLRTCTKCSDSYPATTDYFYKRTSGILAAECKSCSQGRTKVTYTRNRDRIRPVENAKKRKMGAELKDRVFQHYGGWICACCGEEEKMFLTLDHINNDGAEFRRMITGDQSRGGGQITYRWLERNGYPEGFQVLCGNCQHGKRMNGGTCPHQTTSNDQPKGVGSSEPKRNASQVDDDMVYTESKDSAVLLNFDREHFARRFNQNAFGLANRTEYNGLQASQPRVN
jgi:hypothetical protein